MTHKSKIKELVGRGLNSYHSKTLKQIDRIEKKNKEQNYKIGNLVNELDNDYITKAEEGSVISLEHSKEGMVYIDELEGNTLVNYCTDGSKELTLNDEIDTEGINVTLNNTIDNGIVDVSLEGDTLVNVCDQKDPIAITKSYTVENTNHIPLQGEYDGKCRPVVHGNTMVNLIKPRLDTQDNIITYTVTSSDPHYFGDENVWIRNIDNTKTHTIILNILENTVGAEVRIYNYGSYAYFPFRPINIPTGTTGMQIYTTTQYTQNNQSPSDWLCFPLGHGEGATIGGVFKYQAMIFEGDLTQTPNLIPNGYVEGLKSSFENNEEPANANIFKNEGFYSARFVGSVNSSYYYNTYSATSSNAPELRCTSLNLTKLIPNTNYTVSLTDTSLRVAIHYYNKDYLLIGETGWLSDNPATFTTHKDAVYGVVYLCKIDGSTISPNECVGIQLELGNASTTYVDYTPKYKVEYKVTGRNKYNKDKYPFGDGYSLANSSTNVEGFDEVTSRSVMFKLLPNTTYTYSADLTLDSNVGSAELFVLLYDNSNVMTSVNRIGILSTGRYSITFSTDSVGVYCELRFDNNFSKTGNEGIVTIDNIQLEEGTAATSYEPYKESTKTFYLNSPLLEGDTIEDINGKATHVKRYGKVVLDGSENFSTNYPYDTYGYTVVSSPKDGGVVFCDNFISNGLLKEDSIGMGSIGIGITYSDKIPNLSSLIQYLQVNPTTVVYELASPIYETISEESILCDSYVNGHLDFDTNIPIERIQFLEPYFRLNYLNNDSIYTVRFISDSEGILDWIDLGGYSLRSQRVIKGINKFTINSPASYNVLYLGGIGFNASNIQVVATDKEFGYFEGMKSVGECEDNKIEILSSIGNNNLIKNSDIYTTGDSLPHLAGNLCKDFVDIIRGKSITLSLDVLAEGVGALPNGNQRIGFELECLRKDGEKAYYNVWVHSNYNGRCTRTITVHDDIIEVISFGIYVQVDYTKVKVGRPKIELGNAATLWCPSYEDDITDYPSFINKKEITLSEPLRALPNGVKDKIVKQNGKWYIERNCLEYKPTSNDDWTIDNGGVDGEGYLCCYTLKSFLMNNSSYISRMILCDKLPFGEKSFTKEMCCYSGGGYFEFILKATTLDEFKARLDELKPTVIVPTLTPTYEEITDVELITYLDITHISNNSAIPCNMKVANTGYNAIIKPSTQYTVAFDTDISGEVGINLAGSKVTTTNNIATVTTPSTLTDDTLRLTGKGIKASKARLLEGDKSNWIPSYFEGMKSSFEDKVQADGTYKMEILSNNKNLLTVNTEPYYWRGSNKETAKYYNGNIVINGTVNEGWDAVSLATTKLLKRNTTYTITCKINQNINVVHGLVLRYWYNGKIVSDFNYLWGGGSANRWKYQFITPNFSFDMLDIGYIVTWDGETISQTYNNLVFSEIGIGENYTPHKSNKIQFSSIEPLRGVGNVKDRFVFKEDGKLMIERNCKEIVLNGSESWYDAVDNANPQNYTNTYRAQLILLDSRDYKPIIDRFVSISSGTSTSDYENAQITGKSLYLRINRKKLSTQSILGLKNWLQTNPIKIVYQLENPTYEEIPHELQKIILEGYKDGTLFFDTNIPPTVTTTYAGETPIVKATKLNKTEVLKNTDDINDNIVPYLMDMDFRVVCLQLEGGIENISMSRLFGGTYEMLQRDIQSKRYSIDEYKYRLEAYLSANKITQDEYEKLGGMLSE